MFNLNEGIFHMLTVSAEWQKWAIEILFVLAVIVVSYLLGSINSAIIISKLLYKDDIRKYGSGNAGMTNMLRTFGKRAALFTARWTAPTRGPCGRSWRSIPRS